MYAVNHNLRETVSFTVLYCMPNDQMGWTTASAEKIISTSLKLTPSCINKYDNDDDERNDALNTWATPSN